MGEKASEFEKLERICANQTAEPIRISYSVIESITKNFCQAIGHGGFGIVYLGALRNDVMVAVKQLHPAKDLYDSQFMAEVECLKRANHKNIVRFLGYCAYTHETVMKVDGKDRMVTDERKRFLCFKYAPNGNLHDYLQEKGHGYQWSIRYKIIKGICQGLHHLHQKHINHLDLKPANVLLGAHMEPKITDFGLSRCNDGTHSTIVTCNLKGTLGYMPPEMISEGKISSKVDIFCLGKIMTRLLAGSNDNITKNCHESLNDVECQQMERCIEIARACADSNPNKRPKISDIMCKLADTETTIQNVHTIGITEPGKDPKSMLYQNVKIFLARSFQTHDYYRGAKKLPAERPKWKLVFHRPPKLPIVTGKRIEDTNGNPLVVILVDADTGTPSAPPDVLPIELVPLLGNFPRDSWDAEDFRRGVVEGKGPLLAGDYRLTMWDGYTTVNNLMFTDDSQRRGCLFRIGVRVVLGSRHGDRVLEAMTEAFMVKGSDELQDNKHYYIKWQLAFQSQPRHPIYQGVKITDAIDNPLEVILLDAETGAAAAARPTELDIQLVQLVGEFPRNGSKGWSADDFHKAIVKPGTLSGDVSLTMKDGGRVTVNKLQFTASAPFSSSRRRIGVRVVPGSYHGPGRILEAMTQALFVHDMVADMQRTPYVPEPGYQVSSLESVPWGAAFHKSLTTQNNIRTVQDFLRMLAAKPNELRMIMSGDDDMVEDSTWEKITRYARRCEVQVDKVYAYRTVNATIYVNSIFDLIKVELGGVECPLQQLDEAQKRLVKQAMREAYDHQHSLQEVKLTWKLAFKRQPRLPINVGCFIYDTACKDLEVILVDANTGAPSAAPPVELKIQLVSLLGDFPPYEHWSTQEFQAAIVKQRRQQSVPALQSYTATMTNGSARFCEVAFKDDSSWVRGGKFRIGAWVVPGGRYEGAIRIVEGMTEAFEVGDVNRKHYPAALDDPVWRLNGIDRDGEFHRKLASNNIDTVLDFARMLNVNPRKYRAILGDAISDDVWDLASRHACTMIEPGDKTPVYAYSRASGTIHLDNLFYTIVKVEIDGMEYTSSKEMRGNKQKTVLARQLFLEAWEHRHNLQQVWTLESSFRGGMSIGGLHYDADAYMREANVKLDEVPSIPPQAAANNLQQTWKLVFKSQPRLPIHIGCRITDASGDPLEIILVDAKTGSPCALPILMRLGIELLPLLGDFSPRDDDDDDDTWSAQEFRKAIVKPRQETHQHLLHDGLRTIFTMKDGRATLEGLVFTDDSSWVPCGKFRIGACVLKAHDYDGTIRILEAMTEPVAVEDDVDRKHYPPAAGDPVWRLEMIDKDGAFHRNLTSNNVHTVQELVKMLNVKPGELRAIMGDDMTNTMWTMATCHAKRCAPEDKVYAYKGAIGTIYVDSVFNYLRRIEIDGVECPLPQSSWDWNKVHMIQMMFLRKLILEAYEHRHNLQEVGAAMELRDYGPAPISYLLRCAERYATGASGTSKGPDTAAHRQR